MKIARCQFLPCFTKKDIKYKPTFEGQSKSYILKIAKLDKLSILYKPA